MGKLYFRYSVMGAGKSLDLIKTAYNYEEQGLKTWLITSAMDTRGNGSIYSRAGMQREAFSASLDDDLFQLGLKQKAAAVFVDEVQFFTEKQIWQLANLAALGPTVFCYGIRTDSQGNLWPATATLFAIADKLEELKTLCWCGAKATMVAMVHDDKVVRGLAAGLIQIDNEETRKQYQYVSLCRQHWQQGLVVTRHKIA